MSQRSVVLPVLAAMGSFALMAADVTETFETGTAVGDRPADWTGYCAVSNQVGAYAKATPGTPVVGDHTKVLWVEGSAVRTYSESNGRVVDLLVMAEELPDEELPAADGDEQIKFAFDTNGCINLYHKVDPSSAAQWSKLSDVPFEAGTWVRTTFTFDYDSKMCQLKVDGSPYVSAAGYRSPSSLVHPGSWYYLAKSDAAALTKIDFVGCGGVDDVVNAASATYTPVHSGDTATNGIEYAWFDENGLAWSDGSVDAPGANGYTVKESYDTGTDPYSDDKFYVTNATYTSDSIILTVNGYGRSFIVQAQSTPFTDNVSSGTTVGSLTSSNKTDNTTTWTGALPTDALTYYRVRNSAAATAETVNQFAIMKVVSSAENTLLALPWKLLGQNVASPAAITAANVVMTNNLVNGDYLIYYDSSVGAYKGWIMNNGAWVAVAASTTVGTLTVNAADATELARGQAIWLVRQAVEGRPLSAPFYLYGQHLAGTTDASQTVPANGLLLANPDATASFLVSDDKISNASNGDEIRIPDTTVNGKVKTIKRVDGVWKAERKVTTTISGGPFNGQTSTTTTWVTDTADLTIGAGRGFMYVRPAGNASATDPVVTW